MTDRQNTQPTAECPRCGRTVRVHLIHRELFTHRTVGPDRGGICRGSGLRTPLPRSRSSSAI